MHVYTDEQAKSWIQADNGTLMLKTYRYGWQPVCSETFQVNIGNTYCQSLGYARALRYNRTYGNQ